VSFVEQIRPRRRRHYSLRWKIILSRVCDYNPSNLAKRIECAIFRRFSFLFIPLKASKQEAIQSAGIRRTPYASRVQCHTVGSALGFDWTLCRAFALLSIAILSPASQATAATSTATDYERDIKPILRQRCYSCHSRLKQKAELRLDAGSLIHKGSKHGPVLVIGNSDTSPLIKRVLSNDEDERMPPEGKPLTAEQIDLLRRWIDQSAHFPKDEIVPQTPGEHWAFQPIRRPAVPNVKNKRWVRNPIDAFVLEKLEQRGWKPAPEAEPRALLRRVYLDLTGLPPSLAQHKLYFENAANERLDQVIDELLDQPTYGERWARHWLDVVRYADSNGYERDAEKPFVWRYRDYVINSFNDDKPFDRFILEQLAGDELPEPSAETLIATGFQRLGHWDDEPADPATDRFDQLDDIVSTTAQAFLGLTIGCARCHDHKFEPFTTRDYYSMVAVFNPLHRPRDGRTELTVPVGTRKELSVLARRNRELGLLKQQTNTLSAVEIQQRTQSLTNATPDLLQAYIFQELAPTSSVTRVLIRGSVARPGDSVEPAIPGVLVKQQLEFPKPDEHTSRRRLGLSQWLINRENPLTARVIVNRIWLQHFGYGLVRTPNDFGLMGEAPTHPELLDWLSHWFMLDAGWSLKKLHRLILTSNTWRMNKNSTPSYASTDPEERLLWRMPYRRLEVEAIRDSVLAVSGQLNSKMFGPAMKPRIQQAALEANTDKETIWKPSDETEASRRTIYAFIKRGLVIPMLEVMDLADTVNSCPQRQVTTVAPQALTLFNGEFVNDQARHFADRLLKEAGIDSRKQIALAWQLALCRKPSKDELSEMLEFYQTETERLLADAKKENKMLSDADAQKITLQQICRVILNLNEFVYPE
jgi:hypothetical protein